MRVFNNFREFVVGILPLFYLLFYTFHFPSTIIYIPYLSLLFIVLNKGVSKNKECEVFFFIILVFIICTCLSGYITKQAILYIGLLMLFLFDLPEIAEVYAKKPKYILTLWAIIISLMILPKVLSEIGTITQSRILAALRLNNNDGDFVKREDFGFFHPNTAGCLLATNIIVMCKILCMRSVYVLRKRHKSIIIANIGISIYGMLATGSRGALLFIVFFGILLFYRRYTNLLNAKFRLIINAIIFLFLVRVFIMDQILFNMITNSSGRDTNFLMLLKAIYANGNILFGVGLSPISSGFLSQKVGMKLIIDGWYQYMFGCIGMVGLLCLFVLLQYLVRYFLRHTYAEAYNFNAALIVSFALYSLTENITITPGVLLSLVFWTLIYGDSKRGMYNKVLIKR